MLNQQSLKELLHYEPETGQWTRLVTRGRFKKGTNAGHLYYDKKRNEYRNKINVDYKIYLSYRLAFLYMTGNWPKNQVDHIDGDSSNDRWDNLREANGEENQHNQSTRKNNTSGYKGVSFHRGKWRSRIRVGDNRYLYLGRFDSKKEAAKVYNEAASKYHGKFAKLNIV